MPRPLTDFKSDITGKFRYLEPELDATTSQMFTAQLFTCLQALHRSYQTKVEVKHNSAKLFAHTALFEVLHAISCRVVARFLREQDRSALQTQLQQVIHIALVNADPSLIAAHAALETFLTTKINAYFEFVLEQLTFDNISISKVIDKLRDTIIDDVIENVPILCGYDIYSRFAENLKLGMDGILEFIEANASSESIDDFVMEYTPLGYRINIEGKRTTEPGLYIEVIADELQAATREMFNPATIMSSAPHIFAIATSHQQALGAPPDTSFTRSVYHYVLRRHQLQRRIHNQIDTLAEQRTNTVIGEYMAQRHIGSEERDALLSFGEGEVKRCVMLTITSTLQDQLKPYYAVADILTRPPSSSIAAAMQPSSAAAHKITKPKGPMP